MTHIATTGHLYAVTLDLWAETEGNVGSHTRFESEPQPLKGGTDVVVFDVKGQPLTIHTTLGYRHSKEGTKIPAPGRLIIKETGQTLYNGDLSQDPWKDQTAFDFEGPFAGWRGRMVLRRVPRKRVVNGPKGKVCGQCRWWDKQEGNKLLTEKTHLRLTKEGGYCFNDVVARALAEEFSTPYLHPEDAGFCPRRKEIIDAKGDACEEFAPLKLGAWSRFWAWVRR